MRKILTALTLSLVGLSGCTPTFPLEDGREASTLTGAPLMRIAPDAAKLPKVEQELGDAKVAWVRDGTEEAAIQLGRAYAALGL